MLQGYLPYGKTSMPWLFYAPIYYNTAILPRIPERLEAKGNERGIEALIKISPVVWPHIVLTGHSTFQINNEIIDLDALVTGLKLE